MPFFASSFDAAVPLAGWTVTGTPTIVTGRNLNGCRMATGSQLSVTGAFAATTVAGVGYRTNNLAGEPCSLFDASNAFGGVAKVTHVTDGRLALTLYSFNAFTPTTVLLPGFAMSLNTWYYLELVATIAQAVVPVDATHSNVTITVSADLYVNNFLLGSGVDVRVSNNLANSSIPGGTFTFFRTGPPGGGNASIVDDVYINATRIGDAFVQSDDTTVTVEPSAPDSTQTLFEVGTVDPLAAPDITQTLIEVGRGPAIPNLSILCAPKTLVIVGVPFSTFLIVSGGTLPYTFALLSGPGWLSLNTVTGELTGTAPTTAAFSYSAQVTDSSSPPLTATVTCQILVGGGTCRTTLNLYQHSVSPQVETITDRNDDWTNCSWKGNKFFQGIRIDADTFGQNKTIFVRDSDTLTLHALEPAVMNHQGRTTKPYSFAVPFTAHEVRRETADVVPMRMFGVEYVWEETPEFTYTWKTQRTSHGLKGFHHVQQIIMTYCSNAPVTLTMSVYDGVAPQIVTLASTGGVFQKVVVVLTANKGMLFDYELQSTASSAAGAFQLWKNQMEVRVGEWGRTGDYINYQLLGGRSGDEASI